MISARLFRFVAVVLSFLVHLIRRLKVHCCDHALSVRRLSSLTFNTFDFFSETAKRNSTKLDKKQDLNVLYQVFVFRADRQKQDSRPSLWLAETFSTSPLNKIHKNLKENKISTSSTKLLFFGPVGKNKMAALASEWLSHFRLLIRNRSSDFSKTWQEARSQRPLQS